MGSDRSGKGPLRPASPRNICNLIPWWSLREFRDLLCAARTPLFKLPHGPGEGSLGALIPESWLRRTQTLGAFRGALKQPPHLSTSAILTHASSLLPPPLCLHPWWPPHRAVSRPKELTPAPRCCWRMNQSQRMAPVGTDKELSDLLDFSMVSDPTHPSCPPSSPRP